MTKSLLTKRQAERADKIRERQFGTVPDVDEVEAGFLADGFPAEKAAFFAERIVAVHKGMRRYREKRREATRAKGEYRRILKQIARADRLVEIGERHDWRCQWCGAPLGGDPDALHLGRVVPRSAGGGDEESNLQVLHARCSRQKGGRSMAQAPAGTQP